MRIYTRNTLSVILLSLLWLILSGYVRDFVPPNFYTTLPWIPVLILFPYASYFIYKSSQELSEGVAKEILSYEMLFVALTTVYFFLQRINEIFFAASLPAEVFANYTAVNATLNSAAIFALVLAFLSVLYIISVTQKFSIAYGFKSKTKLTTSKFKKILALSFLLGVVYDSFILIFLENITTVSATLVEAVPLFVLGILVFYNLSKSVNKFTDITRKLLIGGGLYIVLLILHFFIRYVDVNLLFSAVDIRSIIASYTQERIVLSVVLYGILISILFMAVEFSRKAHTLVKKYSMK